MNLSKEHFDKALKGLVTKADLKNFASKNDVKDLAARMDKHSARVEERFALIDDHFEHQTALLISYSDKQIENLATMVAEGINELHDLLDVRERVEKLEKEIKKIKEAAHV